MSRTKLTESAGSDEMIGTCKYCGTKRPIDSGLSRMGRKFIYVLLWCETCKLKTSHKFNLPNKVNKERSER